MTGLWYHLVVELRSGWRNRSLLLLYYLFPLGFYAMMGLIMTELMPDFRAMLIPAMMVFTILSGQVLGLPNPLVEAREAGIFRSYRTNGIPGRAVLAVPTVTAAAHTLVACLIIGLSAPRLFAARLPENWAALVMVTLVTVLAYAGIGALIGVVSSHARSTIMWSQLVYLPSFLLGGVMVPTEMLPHSLARIALLMPTTHAMSAYRTLAYGEASLHDPLAALSTLLAGGIIALLLAVKLFRWDAHHHEPLRHPYLALLALAPYLWWLWR